MPPQPRALIAPVRKPVRHVETKLEDRFLQLVVLVMRIRHPPHQIGAKPVDLVGDRNPRTGKEPGLGAIDESPIRSREPARLDIKREKQGPLGTLTMQIGVLLPRVDGDEHVAAQRHCLLFDHKILVWAAGLEDQVTMRMRMFHQRGVHVEEGHASKAAPKDAQSPGHR